ncbi:class I SAM-dependent methyltransferase [Ureibacillus manganicus]|uniref:SAM-dependent methyltransferase n=1 Tax=Ureibacillus manganicus DSM 26584 TaxID=1384049 RepID=A0A0A3HZR5_9BACL|nr:class I SAM-dependent methyltransferase [Ureibacillus manganicus]KGR76750.1 SAM-dependent methyltransferase [Ureibacillus manganicus DSM 26584]
MLNKQGFDLWANQYDQTVQISEENNQYPFAGYKAILNMIFNEVMQKDNANVLDIGVGTGVLTAKLYENGHRIHGIDFSAKMISIAKEKMPNANLLEWDITNGLPAELLENKFDFIVSTYTLHHLTDEQKVQFISNLLPLLDAKGKILIGDIAFETREKLESCRKESINYWDDDEFYFFFDELKALLSNSCHLEFYQISHCGGVFMISK